MKKQAAGLAVVCMPRVALLFICGALVCRADPITGVESVQLLTDGNSDLFEAVFTGVPDFTTTDVFGRQNDAFQYFIEYSLTGGNPVAPPNVNIIVSGANIASLGDVTVQEAHPFGEGPGGWGPLIDQVPYTLAALPSGEQVLLFDVPLSILAAPGNTFQYGFETYRYGVDTSNFLGMFPGPQAAGTHGCPVPEPGTLPLLSTTVVGLGLFTFLQRRRERKHCNP
jgi:hypothetical protein